jgi:aryl-alcohol dehydrogenase-like predicted oxidoreductase
VSIARAAAARGLSLTHRLPPAARYMNEEAVGRAVQEFVQKGGVAREELFITSKLWDADHEKAAEAINDSLKKLQLEYIDLYLIHSPGNLGPEARLKAWKDLEDAVDAGKIKSIGVSNVSRASGGAKEGQARARVASSRARTGTECSDCRRAAADASLILSSTLRSSTTCSPTAASSRP